MAMAGLVFLIGARASGKTSAGRLLAQELGVPFIDTDERLCAAAGATVAEIVAGEGWDGFRRRESAALRGAARGEAVVATGGGMALAPENRAFMRGQGIVLYLRADAGLLAARLAADPVASLRPSLTGGNVVGEVGEILTEREPLYLEAAHESIDASGGLDEVVALALAAVRRRGAAADPA